jgi:exodeoxyribonuclease V gamma subunit
MKPKCVLPFKVIALLGMNEGDFPKRDTQTTFDLTQVEPKIGDSSKLLEGKNQFLETLLSAQEKLFIFYQGQLAENNAALQPSSVVSDLIDVITEYYGLQEEGFVIKHALQAYHHKYFDSPEKKGGGCHDFYSYHDFHLTIAQKQLENSLNGKGSKALSPWWPIDGKIETDLPTIIEMRDLIAFVKNPQAYFVKQVLQINLNLADSLLEETESFVFTNLEKYLLKDNLVSYLSNRTTENDDVQAKIYQEFKVKGRLLGGEIGRLDFQDKYANALKYKQKFLEIEGIVGLKCEDIIFDFKLEDSNQYQLTGTLSNQYEHAMVLHRFGDIKGKTLTETWIKHLLLNQVIAKTTYLIYGQDEVRILKLSSKDHLLSPLVKWINLFVAGQLKPSDFMSEPGLSYASNPNSASSKKSPVEKAFNSFQKQLSSEFEPEINLLYKQLDEKGKGLLFGDEFQLVCDDLLKPVVEVLGL